MRHLQRRSLCALIIIGYACAYVVEAQTDAPWFWFSQAFITQEYAPDSAFGQMGLGRWAIAGNHSSSCGGNDAEVHIGASWYDHMGYTGASVSGPDNTSSDVTPKWGVVVELTNVQEGTGDDTLRAIPATVDAVFDGYFRAWNEGHWKGSYYPSAPHHVLELHPAYAFRAGTYTFNRPDLVKTMPNYRGYGQTPLKKVLSGLSTQTWPRAFVDGPDLWVRLGQTSNFFQFAVEVKNRKPVTGGHEATVDGFSSTTYSNRVIQNLQVITMTGTAIDSMLTTGSRMTLLGIFSVNLRKALDLATAAGATSEAAAAFIPNALEFFAYGRTTKQAVSSCS
jgi:hypothetical protein